MALTTMPRISMLDLATLSLPDWHPEASNEPVARVYGYVIEHPDGAIIFDTGVGIGNEFIDEVYEPNVRLLEAELADLSVDLDTVVAVVNSHLHFDHCGQNPLFHGTDIPVFVQQAELDNVNSDRYYTDATWALPPDSQRHALSGDLVIADGVSIMATPGHTTGHQSVLVEAGDERVVLAGQAVWNPTEFIDEVATPSNVEADDLRDAAIDSIRRIKSLRPHTIYFAHCSEVHPHADPA